MLRRDGRHRWESHSNEDMRHRHLPSRRRLPPRGASGSLGGRGLFNCWGRGEPSNVSTGGTLGPPSPQRRRHRRWLGSRDDDRLPRITGPCDRARGGSIRSNPSVTSWVGSGEAGETGKTPGVGSRAARRQPRPAAATMGISGPGRRRDHDVRHRDRGGRRWRRWATAAQWAAGRQGGRGRAGRWGQSILSS
jgi:hypothetical protein